MHVAPDHNILISPIFTLLVSLAAPLLLLPFLGGQGIVDMPGQRRAHKVPTVRGGGIGVSLAILFGILLQVLLMIARGVEEIPVEYMAVSLVLVWFTAVGIFDDIFGLRTSAGIVMLGMGGIGVAATAGYFMQVSPRNFGMMTIVPLALLLIPFTVWVTNAANFMDGVNGITSFHVLLFCGWAVYLAQSVHGETIIVLGGIIAAGFAGFVPWNIPRARIFLGESGSYVAGAATLLLAILLWISGVSVVAAIAPMAAYWVDVIFTGLYRLFHKQDPLLMHREHNYQKLQRYLGSHRGTTFIVTSIQIVSVAAAYACGGAHAPWWGIFPVLFPAIVFAAWPIPTRVDPEDIVPAPDIPESAEDDDNVFHSARMDRIRREAAAIWGQPVDSEPMDETRHTPPPRTQRAYETFGPSSTWGSPTQLRAGAVPLTMPLRDTERSETSGLSGQHGSNDGSDGLEGFGSASGAGSAGGIGGNGSADAEAWDDGASAVPKRSTHRRISSQSAHRWAETHAETLAAEKLEKDGHKFRPHPPTQQ